MKLEDAKAFMQNTGGYRVEFEKQEGGILRSDHFPDDGEPTIPIEEEAWALAKEFARAGKHKGIVNVYVIQGNDYKPVEGYKERKLNYY